MNEINKIADILIDLELKDKSPLEILLHILRENKKAKEKEMAE